MRNIAIGCLAAAAVALAAVPASADGVYVGAGPVGVGVGVDHHDGWRSHYAYDDDAVVVRRHHHEHCRVTIVHRHGEVHKIRRCW
jgi:hypothetical protein